MKITDIIFNTLSIITLSGFSPFEAGLALNYAPFIFILLVILRGPWKVYSDILRGRWKITAKSELASWLGFAVVCELVIISKGTDGDAAALLAMLIGGCSGSIFGGITVGRILDSFRLLRRSVVIKAHPSAVVTMRRDNMELTDEMASDSVIFSMVYIALHLTLAFILSFETADFAQALLIAAASLNGSAWYAVLCTGSLSGLSLLSAPMQLFIISIRFFLFILCIFQNFKKSASVDK